MDKYRFNAYKDLIEEKGKASLTQLTNWTASNKFLTKMFLDEIIELNLIIKKGNYYYLNEKELELWKVK